MPLVKPHILRDTISTISSIHLGYDLNQTQVHLKLCSLTNLMGRIKIWSTQMILYDTQYILFCVKKVMHCKCSCIIWVILYCWIVRIICGFEMVCVCVCVCVWNSKLLGYLIESNKIICPWVFFFPLLFLLQILIANLTLHFQIG